MEFFGKGKLGCRRDGLMKEVSTSVVLTSNPLFCTKQMRKNVIDKMKELLISVLVFCTCTQLIQQIFYLMYSTQMIKPLLRNNFG